MCVIFIPNTKSRDLQLDKSEFWRVTGIVEKFARLLLSQRVTCDKKYCITQTSNWDLLNTKTGRQELVKLAQYSNYLRYIIYPENLGYDETTFNIHDDFQIYNRRKIYLEFFNEQVNNAFHAYNLWLKKNLLYTWPRYYRTIQHTHYNFYQE